MSGRVTTSRQTRSRAVFMSSVAAAVGSLTALNTVIDTSVEPLRAVERVIDVVLDECRLSVTDPVDRSDRGGLLLSLDDRVERVLVAFRERLEVDDVEGAGVGAVIRAARGRRRLRIRRHLDLGDRGHLVDRDQRAGVVDRGPRARRRGARGSVGGRRGVPAVVSTTCREHQRSGECKRGPPTFASAAM